MKQSHLKGIKALHIGGCSQLMGTGFEQLAGIERLGMDHSLYARISEEFLVYLEGESRICFYWELVIRRSKNRGQLKIASRMRRDEKHGKLRRRAGTKQ